MTRYAGKATYTSKADVCHVYPQTHVGACDGLYVVGLTEPEVDEGMGAFANHSDSRKPNAEMVRVHDAIALKSLKKIKSGEEITIDYGPPSSESYKMAMGYGRLVVSTRRDGSRDVAFVPIHVHGHVVKVSATSDYEAAATLASDLGVEVTNPSAASRRGFLRCVAIMLDELLSSPQEREYFSVVDAAKTFLDGVDVAKMRGDELDISGLDKICGRMSQFVERLVDVWENESDPGAEAGVATIGGLVKSQAHDDIPDLDEQILAAFCKSQSPKEAGTEALKLEAEIVVGIVAKCLTDRTARSDALTALVIALMLGVDVHVYTVAR